MSELLQIVATGVLYYHDADERAFFEWLDRMAFVREYHGVVEDLFIDFERFPTDDELWEIIGFCRRYGIDMAQLAKFGTHENSAWMRDPKMTWHADIFGDLSNANAANHPIPVAAARLRLAVSQRVGMHHFKDGEAECLR